MLASCLLQQFPSTKHIKNSFMFSIINSFELVALSCSWIIGMTAKDSKEYEKILKFSLRLRISVKDWTRSGEVVTGEGFLDFKRV